jgi:exopolysaccharide biosynthesis polyprenyl glycosylphosphotransferase
VAKPLRIVAGRDDAAEGSGVNTTERVALTHGPAVYEDLASVVDARTLEILERRRKTATIRRRGWLIRRVLLAADLIGLSTAFALAELLWPPQNTTGNGFAPSGEVIAFAATLPIWVFAAKLYGLYDRDEERTDHSSLDDTLDVFHLVTVGAWFLFIGGWLTTLAHPTYPKLATFWLAAIFFVSSARALGRAISRRQISYLQNTVIVGAGDVGQLVARKLLTHPEYGINLVGFIDDRPKERRTDLENLALLGNTERLPAIVRLFDIERIIVAFSNDDHKQVLELIRSMKDLDVQIDVIPRLFEIISPGVEIHTVEGLPLIGLPPLRLSRSSRLIKRMSDLVLATVGLVLLAPAFLAIAVLIRRDSKGPVFFRQVRMGAGSRTFRIYKFRTMIPEAEERKQELAHLNRHETNGDPRMFKIADDPRVTRFGRTLRRYSLDELPQLINVLKGEMSLVGPRPLILDEDRHVDDWARKRLDLKPGVTGLWQVLGRNEIPFGEMVAFDYLYVTNWSLRNDLRLLLKTIPILVTPHRNPY